MGQNVLEGCIFTRSGQIWIIFCRGSWHMTFFWKRGIILQELVAHLKNHLFAFCWNIATYPTLIITDGESVTTLAACSASDNALPSMIVYRGQHFQSTCQSKIDSKHKFYPLQYSNCKSWVTSEIFFIWFKNFE